MGQQVSTSRTNTKDPQTIDNSYEDTNDVDLYNSDIYATNNEGSNSENVNIFTGFDLKYNPQQLLNIIQSDPTCSQSKNKNGEYPLQIAIKKAVELHDAGLADVLFTLVSFYPTACQFCHNLTLHLLIHKSYPNELILAITAANPKLCRIPDTTGHLPLQIAIEKELSSNVIIGLLSAYPEACVNYESFNPKRSIPLLHLAIVKLCPAEVIKMMLRLCPESSICRDSSNSLPLHFALREEASEAVIQLLIDANPSICGILSNYGRLPLSELVNKKFSASVISSALVAYPEGASKCDSLGLYPLHIAAKHHPSAEVVSLLVQAYPDACHIAMRKNCNYLPLHLALSKIRRPAEVIAVLVDAAPFTCAVKVGSSSQPNNLSVLPLHLAIAYGTEESIYIVMNAYPEACGMQDQDGKTPLHKLFERPHDSITADELTRIALQILQVYPDAAVCKSNYSSLPIHVAIQHRAPLVVIEELLNVYPESCQLKDNGGCCSLHVAIKHDANIDIINLLLDYFPNACIDKDRYGLTPVHYASMKASAVMLNELIFRFPSAAQEGDIKGRLPIHVFLHHLETKKIYSFQEISCLSLLLKAFPESTHFPSLDGETAITTTVKHRLGAMIMRLILNANPEALTREANLYYDLNWHARRNFLRVCDFMSTKRGKLWASLQMIRFDQIRNEPYDADPSGYEEDVYHLCFLGCVIKLCHSLENSKDLASGYLHQVVLFL